MLEPPLLSGEPHAALPPIAAFAAAPEAAAPMPSDLGALGGDAAARDEIFSGGGRGAGASPAAAIVYIGRGLDALRHAVLFTDEALAALGGAANGSSSRGDEEFEHDEVA